LRFGKVDFSDGIRTQDRLLLWDESRALIWAYPLFGTGLGGYESGFLKYKVTFPLVRDAFAHNDYLQYLIELGAVGFALAATAAIAILSRTVKLFIRIRGEERILSAACCGGFAAILLHSTVDFNLFVPANELLLAWFAGLACSLGFRDPAGVIPPARSALSQIANRTLHYDAITRMSRA
jgi:O-antigen ligase